MVVDDQHGVGSAQIGHSAALLQPLVDALRRHVMAATELHADDTPAPVLAPGNDKTKPDACGCICVPIGRPATPLRRPSGLPMRWTARASTRSSISHRSAGRCRPTRTGATRRSTKRDALPKQRAGPMRGRSSTNCMQRAEYLEYRPGISESKTRP